MFNYAYLDDFFFKEQIWTTYNCKGNMFELRMINFEVGFEVIGFKLGEMDIQTNEGWI